jgi:hypothetical protein
MHNLGKMIWLQLAKREIEQPDLKSALLNDLGTLTQWLQTKPAAKNRREVSLLSVGSWWRKPATWTTRDAREQ